MPMLHENEHITEDETVLTPLNAETEVEELESQEEIESEESAEPAKYRIGDKSFKTMAEAHAYATSQLSTLETEAQVADAYRRGVQEALQTSNPIQNVTPSQAPEDDFNEEEYFADPKGFLKKFSEKIKAETIGTLTEQQTVQAESNRIWNEFTSRHPALADFRNEAETFVGANVTTVKAIIATKGQSAAYDYIAMKLREQFSKYAEATKPTRKLPNGGNASPSGQSRSVTPKQALKKPLSFAEQIRSIKKRK